MWQIRTGRLETPFDGGTPFWVLSLVAHLALILIVARMVMPSIKDRSVNLSVDMEQSELAVTPQSMPVVEYEDLLTEETGADGESEMLLEESKLAMPLVSVETDAANEMAELEFSPLGLLAGIDGMESGAEAFAPIATKGEAGEAVAAAAGAVDRISVEILESLKNNKTLVVWLFDQSGSLLEQRQQILRRLKKVYQDLENSGMLGDPEQSQLENQRLLTDVVAFGNQINPMLKQPVADHESVANAISQIELDSTGVENVMEAVMVTAAKYKWMHRLDTDTGLRKRNIRMIIVSDEAGDDGARTDAAVKLCRKHQIPVYVIGVPAPFGRQQTVVKWVDPDPQYDSAPQVAKVRQGPESLMPERLQLDLTGEAEQLDMIDSGFGPFDLTRLCYETGGIYFAVHPNRNRDRRVRWSEVANYSSFLSYFFDGRVMKAYRPDYVSRSVYEKSIQKSRLRAALVKAAAFTSAGTLLQPRLRFPKFDEAQFVNLVSRAQRDAAVIEPQLNQLFEIIRAGEVDRDEETSLRWQAGFDLAIGQSLAAKLRAETYNMMLAMVKTQGKFDPPSANGRQNNTWLLRPADSVTTGSRAQKMAEKAKAYLERVVKEHPGTPWALIAQRELAIPIGWRWSQAYTTPPSERRPRRNNNNRPRDDADPVRPEPLPRRAPPKL